MKKSNRDRTGASTRKALSLGTVAVNDGRVTSGYITKSDRGYFALGPDYELIGIYRSQAEAMKAIPTTRDNTLSRVRGTVGTEWYPNKRDEQRALEREATKILAADRRSQSVKDQVDNINLNSTAPTPSRNGWRPLSDLKRVIRERENSK